MPCCCNTTAEKSRDRHCPECEAQSLPVNIETMRHQLQSPENRNIIEDDYFFCSSEHCHTAYFSAATIYSKQQLRAYQPQQKKLLCYCFDISESHYLSALKSKTSEPIKSFVIEQTKSSACACETRNPSGRCCLANFKRLEKNHGKR